MGPPQRSLSQKGQDPLKEAFHKKDKTHSKKPLREKDRDPQKAVNFKTLQQALNRDERLKKGTLEKKDGNP